MKSKVKKVFYGLLACCLVCGFQLARGAVLCIGAGGLVSIEMTCGALVFPQQQCSASFPLRSDILPAQDGSASCDQCALDIPAPGIAAIVRMATPDRSLLLPPVNHWAALFSNAPGRDQGKAANYSAARALPDHCLALLRTTVLLV